MKKITFLIFCLFAFNVNAIEKKTTFVNILENAGSAKGVQIFIGSKNFFESIIDDISS